MKSLLLWFSLVSFPCGELPVAGAAVLDGELYARTWQLVRAETPRGTLIPLGLDPMPYLRFSAPDNEGWGRVSGSVGCNGIESAIKLDGTGLETAPFLMTEMWCGRASLFENALVRGLDGVEGVTVEGDALCLYGGEYVVYLTARE